MSDILTTTVNGITTITINRVEKKNSITSEMYLTLASVLTSAASDPATRVAVILGDESVFSAGNDIQGFLDAPESVVDSPGAVFLSSLSEFPKPVVAGVCGAAVGIGTTMLLHCDLVYAGDNAFFSLPFVNLGLCPEAASSYLLPQLFGYHRAAEMLLLGKRLGAEDAHQMGLVNSVVPAGEVAELTQRTAAELAAQPATSLLETKRLLKSGQVDAVRDRFSQEFEVFGHLLQEPAAKEAFSAFFEGRAPDFRSVGQ